MAAQRTAAAEEPFPVSADDWVRHLEQHDAEFRGLLKTATEKRRGICERVRAVGELPEAGRLYPRVCREFGHSPHWSHLSAGSYCFTPGPEAKLVLYVASIGHTVYACSLQSTASQRVYDLLLDPLFHDVFKPISLVLDEAGVPDSRDTYVFALDGCFSTSGQIG